jgi:acyl-CoA reductase-like NAD-dependent aldehyde dehydrogenase
MPFDDVERGLGLANDSRYGLTASIWTVDEDLGMDLAARIEAGTVFVNRCDYVDPSLAWTGIKDSGFGCTLSSLAFAQVTRPKSFHVRAAK